MENNRVLPVTLADGLKVEAVAYASGTLCLSTQAGCALACPFCASGSRGFFRNLSLGELWAQVDEARGKVGEPKRLTLSGIGEPLQNFRVVHDFVHAAKKQGLAVSVTSCATPLCHLVPLLNLPSNGVMISLHAALETSRRQLLPHAPTLNILWPQLENWYATATRRARRRLGFNYLLLAGVNDSAEEISSLARLLRAFPEVTLHLLTHNRVEGSAYHSPGEEHFTHVYDELRESGLHVRRSNRWRRQHEGGCGTLFVREYDRNQGEMS